MTTIYNILTVNANINDSQPNTSATCGEWLVYSGAGKMASISQTVGIEQNRTQQKRNTMT